MAPTVRRGHTRFNDIEPQLGMTRLTPSRWSLCVDLSQKKNGQLEVSVNNNQIEVRGKFTNGTHENFKTFNGSYQIPEGYICTSTKQTESKFVVNAIRKQPITGDEKSSGILQRLQERLKFLMGGTVI